MATSKLPIIGTNALVDINGAVSGIPAKVDTGADGTAIWASDIHLSEDGTLRFVFFDEQSPLYTGEIQAYKNFRVVKVTGSTGHEQLRFSVRLPLRIEGKLVRVWCSLTDRSGRMFPMLIGKRTLRRRFLVDVSKEAVKQPKTAERLLYTDEYHRNPAEFLEKYKDQLIIRNEA